MHDWKYRKVTKLKAPELTPEEQAHVNDDGRVFIVEEINGPLWRVLAVKKSGCKVLLKPVDMDGYSDLDNVVLNAQVIANLSADRPLVRDEIWTRPHCVA